MTQTTQSNNTMNEEGRKIRIRQGGVPLLFGPINTYWDYAFDGDRGWLNKDDAWVFREVSREFMRIMSENKVVSVSVPYRRIERHYKEGLGKRKKWTAPIYKENGGVGELKQHLKDGKYGDLLWADCMWYESKNDKLFDIIPTEHRRYFRKVTIILNKLDYDFIDSVGEFALKDGYLGYVVKIYPHSKVEYCKQDNETIKDYINRKDYICKITMSENSSSIIIEPNPTYISYKELLDIISPLFEERGFYIEDKTNPFIRAGFSSEQCILMVHTYCGHKFID